MNRLTKMTLSVGCALALALTGSVTAGSGKTQASLTKATDPDETVRVAALHELGKSREPAAIPVLVNAMEDRFAVVQQAAVAALIEIGAPAWPAMREQLGSTNISRRVGAVRVLAAGPDLVNAEALSRAMCDEVWDVRESAITGVVRLGVLSLDKVLPLAGEKQGRGPESALRVIAQWGSAAKAAEPAALVQLGNTNDLRVRRVAAYALMQIGPDAEASLPRLREVWPTLHDQERIWLAMGLARQGAKAQAAADLVEPELLRAEAEDGVVLAAGLARMGPAVRDGVIGRLTETLKGGDKRRAHRAISILGWFGENAKAALPLLVQEFKAGRDPWFAMAAVDAIGAMGPAAREAAPDLSLFVAKGRETPPQDQNQRELLERAKAALRKVGAPQVEPVPGNP